jgi:poly(3-hydroxybutyrate) depolymerase
MIERLWRVAAVAAASLSIGLAGCGGGGGGGTLPPGVAPAGAAPPAANLRTVRAARLATYRIDRARQMTAGVSSGAYMATQLHVAYSATFHGAAIFAGGPYFCAQDNLSIAASNCTSNYYPTNLPVLEQDTDNTAFYGYIDPTSNLRGQKAYVFSGSNDHTVYSSIARDLVSYYQHYGVSVTSNFSTAAGHAWISPDASSACGVTSSPYLNACGFDAEQTFLTVLYGSLAARRSGALTGALLAFDQNEFVYGNAPAYSMDQTGYVYVPASCAAGQTCKLLVALHGCNQGYAAVGNAFVTKSGLNEWADTNSLVVLYPQAIATSSNPQGCWDWWGYDGTDYAARSGVQASAIFAMVQRL